MVLPVREFSAAGYRSLQRIHYPMSRLDVFVGANGVGKSNLYRGLELLAAAAANTLGAELARESLPLAMWAGSNKGGGPRLIRLSAGFSEPNQLKTAYRYEVEVGYPAPPAAALGAEPQIKTERLSYVSGQRRVRLMDRTGPSVMVRDPDGRAAELNVDLLASETALSQVQDPSRYPALDLVRRTLLQWRFYHDLRTDPDAPMRKPCTAVAVPTLASDGANLAAVFGTLALIRQDTLDLDRMIDRAFPGVTLEVTPAGRGISFALNYPDFPHRQFEPPELSDGTLRFLGLAGALLAYRLPPFVALNEPESSLHPDLMEPLAEMIVQAAQRTQIWLVTHSERLAKAIEDTGEGAVRTVVKRNGATTIEGLTLLGTFREDDDED